jgi:hypothetical protein
MKNYILFFYLVFTSHLYGGEISPETIFEFPDSFKCEDRFPHHSFCKSVGFKRWRTSEIRLIKETLSSLSDPKLQFMFNSIKEKGIVKFHRVSFSASWFPNQQERRVEFSRKNNKVLIWVDPVTNVVGFMDSFFSSKNFIDPHAGISRKTFNLLHELTHIYDIASGHVSSSEGLKKAVGWHWDGNHHVIQGQSFESVQNEFKKILTYVKNGESHKAFTLDRTIGISYGFPTLYSMLNSHENFAELISYYILDPTAKDYLSRDIQRELDSILNPKIQGE